MYVADRPAGQGWLGDGRGGRGPPRVCCVARPHYLHHRVRQICKSASCPLSHRQALFLPASFHVIRLQLHGNPDVPLVLRPGVIGSIPLQVQGPM